MDGYFSCAHGSLEGGVVALGLVRIAEREISHGLVEDVLGSEIAADGERFANLCVGPCQRPAATLAVHAQRLGVECVDQRLDLCVPQLPHIAMVAVASGEPAEEDV